MKQKIKTRKEHKTYTNTGFKGISKHKASGKYEIRVNIKDNSKRASFYVGLRDNIQDAVIARNEFITNLL